jgi:hypothetical protein
MARASIWTKQFDPAAEYVVTRALTLGGVPLPVGSVFPKASVDLRRLRCLYDSRKLQMIDPAEGQIGGAPSSPAPAADPGQNTGAPAGAPLSMKHLGFGKWAVLQGETVIAEGLAKADAQARLAAAAA